MGTASHNHGRNQHSYMCPPSHQLVSVGGFKMRGLGFRKDGSLVHQELRATSGKQKRAVDGVAVVAFVNAVSIVITIVLTACAIVIGRSALPCSLQQAVSLF